MRSFYGCSAYKDKGCKFSINLTICSRPISTSHVKALLSEGKTPLIQGFKSPRTGKTFDACLKLEGGRAVFDFDSPRPARGPGASSAGFGVSSRQMPPAEENPFPPAFYDGQ
jgi:hypothetical protein